MKGTTFLAVLFVLTTTATAMSHAHTAGENLFGPAKAGDIAEVRRLMERHTNVNGRDEYQKTPLHHAASRGVVEVAALLIQKGANVNATDEYRETPLHYAAYWGKTEAAALLIRKGAKINARDENLETPLHYAAESQIHVAALLIRKGARVDARDNYLETPLHHAASYGMTEIAALLIQKGAKVNARNEDQWTPLHYAAFAGNTGVAALLIHEGGNVNARDANQRTPLHWAALAGNTEVAALLIKEGADVNARDRNQKRPLDWAESQDKAQVSAPLIQRGAEADAVNGELSLRHQASYAQYAALIGGISAPQSPLAPFESRPVWTEFAKSLDHSWEKYTKMHLAPMRQWASSELAKAISSGSAVFYPFSGPDFTNPYTLFPTAGTYILTALEPIGAIPDFHAMNRKDFDSFFTEIQRSLHDFLSIDYFLSAHMHTGMESEQVNGVLPFLLLFMAKENTRILDVEYWFMEADGTIHETPGFESSRHVSPSTIPGVRILFESADTPGNKPQTLYYFQLNLYNSTFGRNDHFIRFLQNFGPLITFMKSASYKMFDPQASIARQFVLGHSQYVLQEDSGIPFRYFDPSVWALQFYGAYSKPISTFRSYYQADLARIYKSGKDIKPLPFGIGLHFQVGTANLLLATRE